MKTLRNRKGTKFVVDFGPVAMEESLGKELEGKIQQLALGVLAKTDYKGDISLGGLLPPDLYGLTLDSGDEDEKTNAEGGAIDDISRPETTATRSVRIGAIRKNITFPTKLASSKAAGVRAIRVSRVKHDIQYEQLDKHNHPITGFVLHPVINKRNKLMGVTIRPIGSTSTSQTTLGETDRLALAAIVDELSQFKQSSPTGGVSVALSWWGVIGTGISCGLAAVEGGANLYEDGACAAGIIDVLAEDDDEGDDEGDDN
jgi:hypothetical protein